MSQSLLQHVGGFEKLGKHDAIPAYFRRRDNPERRIAIEQICQVLDSSFIFTECSASKDFIVIVGDFRMGGKTCHGQWIHLSGTCSAGIDIVYLM